MAKGAQNPSRNPLRFTDIAEDVAECALAAKKKRWRWQRRSVFRRKKPLAVAKPRATCRPCRKKSNCDGRSRKAWKLPNLPDTKSPRRMYQCMTTTSLEYLLTMDSSRRSLQSPTVITVRKHPTSLSMTFRTTTSHLPQLCKPRRKQRELGADPPFVEMTLAPRRAIRRNRCVDAGVVPLPMSLKTQF